MLIRRKLYVKTALNLHEKYVHERIEAGVASWTAEKILPAGTAGEAIELKKELLLIKVNVVHNQQRLNLTNERCSAIITTETNERGFINEILHGHVSQRTLRNGTWH